MKISVTLANYNHGPFLRRCIEGLLAQTYKHWELVFVDDGSTDDSWSIIEDYCQRDSRIRADRFPKNRGALQAITHCLEKCTGDLLYGAAADDYVCNPNFFELVTSALRQYPRAAGAFGSSQVVSEDGTALWIMGQYSKQSQFVPPKIAILEFLRPALFVPGTSAIWRRNLLLELGGYDPSLGPQTDYYVNHALSMLYGVVYIHETMSVTRLAADSMSRSANHDEFFKRHALVEQKLRSLAPRLRLPDQGLRNWRRAVISGRLSADRQMRLVRLFEEAFSDLKEWERAGLLPEFKESEAYLRERCARIQQALESAISSATATFDEIAGPLALPSSKSAPGILRLYRSLRALLRRVLRGVFGS